MINIISNQSKRTFINIIITFLSFVFLNWSIMNSSQGIFKWVHGIFMTIPILIILILFIGHLLRKEKSKKFMGSAPSDRLITTLNIIILTITIVFFFSQQILI